MRKLIGAFLFKCKNSLLMLELIIFKFVQEKTREMTVAVK
jgi:hypothetical protein